MEQHTLTTPGVQFTAGPGTDFTNGTWTPTDLLNSEFGVQEGDGKLFINIGGQIVQIKTGTSEDTPFEQVNSDWNAETGVARILNKPVIATKVSDLTQDIPYLQNITGLFGVSPGIGLEGIGTAESPYILSVSETVARRFDIQGLAVNQDIPNNPSRAILTVVHSDSGAFERTKSIIGTVTIRDQFNSGAWLLTFKAVQNYVGSELICKVAHTTPGDLNQEGNPFSIYGVPNGLTVDYYLTLSDGSTQVDATSVVTVTTIT